jgi:predicted Ser/Thr protein kinase
MDPDRATTPLASIQTIYSLASMSASQANPEPSSQALPPGTRLEEFVIERVLGSGGFGITYLARDTALGRQVVIKENLPVQFCFRDPSSLTVAPRHSQSDDADNFQWSLENFSKEAAMLASLDHPGIVKVHRSFEAFGTAYFVMPFVEGLALDELSKQRDGRPFSEDELRGMLERMLDALAHLHDRGIYHRDIKPGNILMTTDGNPVLIDFGSARQRLSERSMTVVESAGYTPFEQLQSRGDVGPWSDLYALGATVVKVITGEAPPKANDRAFGDPWQPTSGRGELTGRFSKGFLAGLDRALRLPMGERWQHARAWRQAFVVGKEPVEVIPRAPVGGKSIPSGRHWFVAVCVIFGIGTWLAMRSRDETPQSGGVDAIVLLGGLVVTSDPSGAEVKNAAGDTLGVTPADLKGLKGGLPWLGRLELSGYEPAEVKADVVAGESNLVQPVKLKPSPQKVSVTSEPAGADVWKDGILAGTTPYVWENGIPGASTSYVLKKEGYEDGNVEGTVEIGKPLDLKVVLKPKPVRSPDTSAARILYPWKTHVTCTIFWIGEQPSTRNPTPNGKSSWDRNWSANFGGYDDPVPENRLANHTTGEFRPRSFVPKLSPFYIALPYNDVLGNGQHKPEAAKVIPWFARTSPELGKTVCKGRWVQIYYGSRSCYGQWEDCGPWETDDWEFVFGSRPPKTTNANGAGLSVSPAIRDYLGLRSGQKVHWRFVEAGQVPYGPWMKFGPKAAALNDPDLLAQQRYLEYLRKIRDEEFQKNPSISTGE